MSANIKEPNSFPPDTLMNYNGMNKSANQLNNDLRLPLHNSSSFGDNNGNSEDKSKSKDSVLMKIKDNLSAIEGINEQIMDNEINTFSDMQS